MSNKSKRILAINFGGIGDEILFFPTLKTIKENFPSGSSLTLVLEPRSRSAQHLTNMVDKVITCDIKGEHKYFEIIKLLFKVWTGRYDVVFSSGGSKVIPILLFLMGIKERVGYNSGFLSQLLLTTPVRLIKQQYAANMYHDLAKAVFKDSEVKIPEVYVSQENLDWATEKIGQSDKPVILIHPGVSRMSIKKNIIKFWPPENWVELVMRLIEEDRYKVALVGGPDDEAVFEKLRAEFTSRNIDPSKYIDLFGQTKNIQQLAALIKISNLLVCVDSAPMHVAVGVETQVVAIFGPTDEKKLIPMNDSRFVALKNDCECRPCLWDKRQTSCEKLDCLKIPVDQALETIKKVI